MRPDFMGICLFCMSGLRQKICKTQGIINFNAAKLLDMGNLQNRDCVVVEDVFIEFIQIIVVIDILKEDISESLLIGLAHNGVPPLNTASMICVFSCSASLNGTMYT